MGDGGADSMSLMVECESPPTECAAGPFSVGWAGGTDWVDSPSAAGSSSSRHGNCPVFSPSMPAPSKRKEQEYEILFCSSVAILL